MRLHKVLAEAGVASRRDCEELIRNGQIRVNGQLITGLPAWVDPQSDHITVDGRPMRPKATGPGPRRGNSYVLLNKPRGVISTTDDPQSRRNVLDLIDLPQAPRLFPVGRLDADSTGLILLTNDGELAQALTHPSYQVPKVYHVSVRGRMTDDDVAALNRGVFLAHRARSGVSGKRQGPKVKRAAADHVKLLDYSRPSRGHNERTRLAVTLREGQNREIRRILGRLGFKVRRLQRVAIGPLTIKGLGVGQWRLLSGTEVARLKREAKAQVKQQQPTGGPRRAVRDRQEAPLRGRR